MKSFREIVESQVDKNGVTIDKDGLDGDIPQEELKNTYVRSGSHKETAMDRDLLKMPDASQNKVIGWFATKANMAEGYVIQTLTDFDKKEFGKDSFRIYSKKGTTIAKFDLKKGKVYFVDNDYFLENDKIKWLSPMSYQRLFIDNNRRSFNAFNIV